MRIVKIDRKTKSLKLVPEIIDDLWHLERVIDMHDLVSGSTDRKIKPKEQGEKHLRVKLFLRIEAEKIEFNRETGNLRVTGIIRGGKPEELLELGASHSIEIELGKNVEIVKQELKNFQIERLEKARDATKKGKVLLVVLDDEQADFAVLKEFELEEKGSIKSGKSGKRFEGKSEEGNYFKEIANRIEELKPEKAVVAGPGFTKEHLQKFLKEKDLKNVQFFYASTNSVGKTGLQELLKGNAIGDMVNEMQLVKETKLVEEVFAELGKGEGLVEYGLNEVKKAVGMGAAAKIVLTDRLLLDKREEAEKIMQKTEQTGGEVHLISGEHEAGKKLDSLGGIAAFLRYKLG